MKRFFFLEYQDHRVSFLLNEIGVILSIPMIILTNYFTLFNLSYVEGHIFWQYVYFISRTLPPLVYLVTKRNEDCLKCFNKDQNIRYSIYQYSAEELKYNKIKGPTIFIALKSIGASYDTINPKAVQIEQEQRNEEALNFFTDATVETLVIQRARPNNNSFYEESVPESDDELM